MQQSVPVGVSMGNAMPLISVPVRLAGQNLLAILVFQFSTYFDFNFSYCSKNDLFPDILQLLCTY